MLISLILWVVVVVASVIAGLDLVTGLNAATSAPQQAAAAAMAAAQVIVPYCLARAVSEVVHAVKISKEGARKRREAEQAG